jgi:hypothetical protein
MQIELLTTPKPGDGDFGSELSDFLSRSRGKKIRCPKCGWQPRKEDLWWCGPPCNHSWNTFDTAGRCPACNKVWLDTCCLSCHQWSKHVDWYELDPGEA